MRLWPQPQVQSEAPEQRISLNVMPLSLRERWEAYCSYHVGAGVPDEMRRISADPYPFIRLASPVSSPRTAPTSFRRRRVDGISAAHPRTLSHFLFWSPTAEAKFTARGASSSQRQIGRDGSMTNLDEMSIHHRPLCAFTAIKQMHLCSDYLISSLENHTCDLQCCLN